MMSLSKDWILANIQLLVESILSDASNEEYRMVLRIYAGLSTSLARDIAVRAMNHPDPVFVRRVMTGARGSRVTRTFES
jgi:hypothetical protein